MGAEPILPFDIVESTWLVHMPDRILSHKELVGYRALALAKHRPHVNEMMERVDQIKRDNLKKFEKENRHKIKEFDFKPGQLVQMRNSGIEKDLDRKMYPRYLGPMIVVRHMKGGSYILADMNGAVKKEKVAAFRVIPHIARYEPISLLENIYKLIDMSREQIDKMVEDEASKLYVGDDFIFPNIPEMKRLEPGRELVDDDNIKENQHNENADDEDIDLDDPRQTRHQKIQRELEVLMVGLGD
ncbi:hypothetical protein Moror_15754 [Moniliophthora roreri MCA 2997]|uniref:Uncharacterized protein n=1 Tax=Moniliophthora roreri (strain MCA 2997) TaxID=1381753 RepID=V2WJU4_MONRO|nr:hypothetical protein Moror_15754 [Moniliophthora roreri MCA 2997]